MKISQILYYLICLFILVCIFQQGLKNYLPLVTVIDELILICMIGIYIINNRGKLLSCKINVLNIAFISLISIIITSKLLNNSPFLNMILASKFYLIGFIFYYIISDLDEMKIEKIFKLFIYALLFQIPIILFQFLYGMINGNLNVDSLSGSFSSSNTLSYAMFIPVFYYITQSLLNFEKKNKIILSTLLIMLIAGLGRYALLMLPCLIITYHYKKIILRKSSLKKTIVIFSLFFMILAFTMKYVQTNEAFVNSRGGIFYMFRYDFLTSFISESELSVSSGGARLLWYPITFVKLSEFSFSPWIGMGPGMYASYTAFRLMPKTNESIYNIFNQLEHGVDVNVDSQIIPLWGELGYIGIILFFLLFIYIIIRYFKLSKQYKDIEIKSLLLTVSAGTLFVLIGCYINHFIEEQVIIIPYFLFLAYADIKIMEFNNNEKNE